MKAVEYRGNVGLDQFHSLMKGLHDMAQTCQKNRKYLRNLIRSEVIILPMYSTTHFGKIRQCPMNCVQSRTPITGY